MNNRNKLTLIGFALLCCFSNALIAKDGSPEVSSAIQKAIGVTSKWFSGDDKNTKKDASGVLDMEPTQKDSSNSSSKTQRKPSLAKATATKKNPSKADYSNTPTPTGAVSLDLKASMNIKILEGQYNILDFPFLITAVDFDEFKGIVRSDANDFPDSNEQQTQEVSPISIDQKENRLVINSKVIGKTQMIVWGGEFPVIVNLTVNKKDGKPYYKILAKNKISDEVALRKLESNAHERVLNILVVALYKNIVPKGYEKTIDKQVFDLKKEGIKLVKEYSLNGRYYIAEKWNIINMDKKKDLNLYESMFYTPNTYSVSLLNNVLSPLRSTSIYIVKRAIGK